MHGFKYSPEWQDNQDRFFGFFYFYFSTGSTQYSVQKKKKRMKEKTKNNWQQKSRSSKEHKSKKDIAWPRRKPDYDFTDKECNNINHLTTLYTPDFA